MFWIRGDGNAKIGAGHLMRCLTIAEAMAELAGGREEILFVCADEDSAALVRENGFSVKVTGTDYRCMEAELPFWEELFSGRKEKGDPKEDNQEKRTDVILIDSYYVTYTYLEKLRESAFTVLLDDMQEKSYPVDAVINYNAFASEAVYRELYGKRNTRIYVGSRYVPIRKQFLDRPYQPAPGVENVLITTGGGDVSNIAGEILRVILEAETEIGILNYHLIIGKYNPHRQELERLAEQNPKIHLHYHVKDMAALMEQCDMAVTAGGTTVYELASVGVPFICFSYAENQELLTQYIGEEKIAGYAGAYHKDAQGTLKEIKRLFLRFCQEPGIRNTCYLKEKEMVDGLGARRLAEEVLSIAGKRGRDGHHKKNLLYGIIAILGFLALFFATFFRRDLVPKEAKAKIVVFGDSIMGECRDDTSVTALLGDYLGEPVFNGALGGTCYSYTDTQMRLAYTKDCLNMAGLSRAILTEDYRIQENARIRESATEYFEDTIYELSRTDFDAVETVLLAHGLNDYHGGVALENPGDPMDIYTFAGAIRSSVANLRKANPKVRIILVTSTYTWYRVEGLTCEEYDTGAGVLEDYVEAELALAEELDLEVIDLYHDLYSHEIWEDWQKYTNDGIHPNETGREMIARRIADYLEQHSQGKEKE